jgi:hypothetical protein
VKKLDMTRFFIPRKAIQDACQYALSDALHTVLCFCATEHTACRGKGSFPYRPYPKE